MYIGIDPGLSGAMAMVADDGTFIEVVDIGTRPWTVDGKKRMVCVEAIKGFLGIAPADIPVFIEKVQAQPRAVGKGKGKGKSAGMGSASSFNFGYGAGILEAVSLCYGHETTLVRPQAWKKTFSLIGTEKDAARVLAERLYPTAELHLKKHSGRADALLIAEHGRRLCQIC